MNAKVTDQKSELYHSSASVLRMIYEILHGHGEPDLVFIDGSIRNFIVLRAALRDHKLVLGQRAGAREGIKLGQGAKTNFVGRKI